MTDNVISFKQAKKHASYAKKETQAAENRKKFGRSKAEKRVDKFEKRQADIQFDGHKLDDE